MGFDRRCAATPVSSTAIRRQSIPPAFTPAPLASLSFLFRIVPACHTTVVLLWPPGPLNEDLVVLLWPPGPLNEDPRLDSGALLALPVGKLSVEVTGNHHS